MARQLNNEFTSWDFRPEEIATAATFTDEQTAFINNEISKYAKDLVFLQPQDGEDDRTFFVRRAELQGRLLALKELLAMSAHFRQEAAEAHVSKLGNQPMFTRPGMSPEKSNSEGDTK